MARRFSWHSIFGLLPVLLAFIVGTGSMGCGDDDSNGEPDGGVDAEVDSGPDAEPPAEKKLTFLQTTDVHSHGCGFGPFRQYTPMDTTDQDVVIGGLARVAKKIREIRAEKEREGIPVILVDSGDFFMGTVYDLTFMNALSLQFFQAMGYVATTIGNHEYDWGPGGIAFIISKAAENGAQVPILATNSVFDPNDDGDDGLEQLKDSGLIVDKVVREFDGVKVGFLGIMGRQAAQMAPLAPPVTFNHDESFLQQKVDELRSQDGVDLVVLVSHAGVHADCSGEDADIASAVDGIDVIASGHYHELTEAPCPIGDTLIFISGSYTDHVGQLDVTYEVTDEGYRVKDYSLTEHFIDDSVGGDATIQALVESYNEQIDNILVQAVGLEAASPVANIPFDMPVTKLEEIAVGNLAADAVRAVVTHILAMSGQIDPSDPLTIPAAAALPSGVLRDDWIKGTEGILSLADVFNLLPTGMTPDQANQWSPGYPLVVAYLTPKEIALVGEVTISGSVLLGDDTVWMNPSGVRFVWDPNGAAKDHIRHVYLCGNAVPADQGGDGDIFSTQCTTELDLNDDTSLYMIITDLYTLLMMPYAETNYGIHIVPKHRDGTPVDFSDPADYMSLRVDADPASWGVQELKSWMAVLFFLQAFEDTDSDGLPNIPADIYAADGPAMGRYSEI